MNKQLPIGVNIIAFTEMTIGLVGVLAITATMLLGTNSRPLNVLSFVYITSFLSLALGIGLLKGNREAYELLIFLASVIIVTKLLIFTNIIKLNSGFASALPTETKDLVSTFYHAAIVFYLKSKGIRQIFIKENV